MKKPRNLTERYLCPLRQSGFSESLILDSRLTALPCDKAGNLTSA